MIPLEDLKRPFKDFSENPFQGLQDAFEMSHKDRKICKESPMTDLLSIERH